MTIDDQIPANIRDAYEIKEWKHACAILAAVFPEQWADILDVLGGFRLHRSHVIVGGGGKSLIAQSLDAQFYKRGWIEKNFDTVVSVDNVEMRSPTHDVDCVKGKVALEVEWSNKDPFYDRDLNNFRLLFELRAISVGVIVTKSDDLKEVFRRIADPNNSKKTLYAKYGASTTWMGKLIPRIEGGGGGGCPILVFGITGAPFVED